MLQCGFVRENFSLAIAGGSVLFCLNLYLGASFNSLQDQAYFA
jgi:hypothetical protein